MFLFLVYTRHSLKFAINHMVKFFYIKILKVNLSKVFRGKLYFLFSPLFSSGEIYISIAMKKEIICMLVILEGDIGLRRKIVSLEFQGEIFAFADDLVERPVLITKIRCYLELILVLFLQAQEKYNPSVCIRASLLFCKGKNIIRLTIPIEVTTIELLL